MGMNPGAGIEAKALKKVLKDDVILAMNDPKLEKSLENDAGIARWLITELPLTVAKPPQFVFAYETLRATDATARDQLAQAMKMFYAAETGAFRLERMVLSGHSNGVSLWGDAEKNFNPGSFVLDDMMTGLTNAFPKAAGQVEDVMFSACYTVSSIELVIKVFRNVRTVWGYAGLSPAAGAGAERHITKWEKETRGAGSPAKEGVGTSALWTRDASSPKGRYIRNDPAKADMKALRQSFYGLSLDVNEQKGGRKAINQGTLNTAYYYVQMMLAHPEATADERAILNEWRDVLLRLRHHDKICGHFATKYSEQIKKAYAAIGRTPPNFAKMSRPALKAEKEAFEAAAGSNADAKAFYDSVFLPFWKLKPAIVPETWI
jgi:hypothetical protein